MTNNSNGMRRGMPADFTEPEPINQVMDPQSPQDVFNGSIQGVLYHNIGAYVIIEFLIGTNSMVPKKGYIYDVGINFVTIYNDENDTFIVCDLYSVKFVTFIPEKSVNGPENIPFKAGTLEMIKNAAITLASQTGLNQSPNVQQYVAMGKKENRHQNNMPSQSTPPSNYSNQMEQSVSANYVNKQPLKWNM